MKLRDGRFLTNTRQRVLRKGSFYQTLAKIGISLLGKAFLPGLAQQFWLCIRRDAPASLLRLDFI